MKNVEQNKSGSVLSEKTVRWVPSIYSF